MIAHVRQRFISSLHSYPEVKKSRAARAALFHKVIKGPRIHLPCPLLTKGSGQN